MHRYLLLNLGSILRDQVSYTRLNSLYTRETIVYNSNQTSLDLRDVMLLNFRISEIFVFNKLEDESEQQGCQLFGAV